MISISYASTEAEVAKRRTAWRGAVVGFDRDFPLLNPMVSVPYVLQPSNETVEKPAYERLMENVQTQGFRNPEE
jgi:hypothetical protein